jgi:hypothetical protein
MKVAVSVFFITSLFQFKAAHWASIRGIFLSPSQALFQRPVFVNAQLGVFFERINDEEMVFMHARVLKIADFLRGLCQSVAGYELMRLKIQNVKHR